MKKKHYLTISFNEFYPEKPCSYTEVVCDPDGDLVEEIELKRAPRAARFDAVFENACGHVNHWNAHRSKRVYGHRLQKSE